MSDTHQWSMIRCFLHRKLYTLENYGMWAYNFDNHTVTLTIVVAKRFVSFLSVSFLYFVKIWTWIIRGFRVLCISVYIGISTSPMEIENLLSLTEKFHVRVVSLYRSFREWSSDVWKVRELNFPVCPMDINSASFNDRLILCLPWKLIKGIVNPGAQ